MIGETAIRQPHPRLRSLLLGPYVGWSEWGEAPIVRREFPFPGVPIILGFGPPFRLSDSRRPVKDAVTTGSFVAGLDDWYTQSESPRGAGGVQVNLTPIGARAILGLPLEELARQVVPLHSLLGPAGTELEARIADAATWEERFDRLEQWLLTRLDRHGVVDRELAWVWQELRASEGAAPIGHLNRALGWSRQQMVRRVRQDLGLSPKLLGRIVRFDGLLRRIRRGRTGSWAGLAAASGYHDQAHLIREVRGFAGCTPTQLLPYLLPDGQQPSLL